MLCRLLMRHFVAAYSLLFCAGVAAEDRSQVRLAPLRHTQAASRVTVRYNVGGDLLLPGREGLSGKEDKQKVPLSVVAELTYQERALAPSNGDQAPAGTETTARYYEQAKATIKIGKGGVNLVLPEERRLIVATADADSASLFSPTGPLTREELDLIDIPAGTHLLDRLMPGDSKRIGDNWKHGKETMQVLLGLDEVSLCEVESVLIGMERGFAKVRLAGAVHGKTDGAATELEVKAGYLFDTRLGRIIRLNLAFSEKREEGRIGPAVDTIGKLSVEVDPLAESEHLGDEQVASLDGLDAVGAVDRTLLLLDDAQTGLRLLHDRRWHVTSQERERVVLRRVEGGEFLAQCNIAIRPERKEGRQDTIAGFERDVRLSLGERFESLVTSGEWTNAAGLRCFRVVAQGKVDDLPMEWRYFLAAPPAGRSIALAVSVEPQFAERLGEADMALVESIQLLAAASNDPAESATSARKAGAGSIK